MTHRRAAGEVARECQQHFMRWEMDKGRGEAVLRMSDGVSVFARVAMPSDWVRGVLLVQHGAGMHSGHIQSMARLLSAKGWLVVIPDLRGHGNSGGPKGDIAQPMQYCDDLRGMLSALAPLGLPQVLVAHSGGVALSLKLLGGVNPPELAGLAMLAPTLAGDGTMVRRSSGGRNLGTFFRYMLSFAPERDVQFPGGQGNAMEFHLGRFIRYKAFGLMGGSPVMTYRPSANSDQSYTYSARGVNGYMTGSLDPLLGKVRCPVFLMTSEKDHYVNSDAVRAIIPWLLAPQAKLTCVHDKRGDHFTTVLLSVPELLKWLDGVLPEQKEAA